MTILKHVLGTYIRKHVSTHISCSVLILEENGEKKERQVGGKGDLGVREGKSKKETGKTRVKARGK